MQLTVRSTANSPTIQLLLLPQPQGTHEAAFLCGGNPRIKKRQDRAPLHNQPVGVPLVGTLDLRFLLDRLR